MEVWVIGCPFQKCSHTYLEIFICIQVGIYETCRRVNSRFHENAFRSLVPFAKLPDENKLSFAVSQAGPEREGTEKRKDSYSESQSKSFVCLLKKKEREREEIFSYYLLFSQGDSSTDSQTDRTLPR